MDDPASYGEGEKDGCNSPKNSPPPERVGARRPAAGKPSAVKSTPEKLCFVDGCGCKKSGKSKFCGDHKKVTDAILYQAEKAKRKAEVERILSDQTQCTKAVHSFERDNRPGRFRKKLIDFSVWLKVHTVEVITTSRDSAELWSFADFSDEKTKCGWAPKEILDKWEEYKGDPSIEQEPGELLWLPCRKRKMRDNVKKISNQYIESSKQLKNLKDADADHLKQFAHVSAASHTHAFFRKDALQQAATATAAATAEEVDDDGLIEQDPKKKKRGKQVDFAHALATVQDKDAQTSKKILGQMKTAVQAAKEALDKAEGKKDEFSAAGKIFYETCQLRCACGNLWLVDTQDALDKWLKDHPDARALVAS